MKILSYGVGVNSTAILALVKLGRLKLGDFKIVFADPGAEKPETYCFLRFMCKQFDIAIVKKEPDLYSYCKERNIIPTRMFRWCTDKWKIRPMRKWAKEQGFENYQFIIGFAKGEENRAKNPNVLYPLIELGIDRDGCKNIISEIGWTVPFKSGCFFCPFQPKNDWLAMRENASDLFQKALQLEQSAIKRNSKMCFRGNQPLEIWMDEKQTRFSPFDEYQHCICSSQ